MNDNDFNWDAADFFSRLTTTNKFAAENGFRFARVSGLEGFLSLISSALSTKAFVAVSDISSGGININNSPHTRRMKTVYLFMRHKAEDMEARQSCLRKLEELFRQFMSVLILEKTRLSERCIYLNEAISFNEVDKYFYTGGACAFFQITIDKFTNLIYNPDEWLTQTT